ncbi:glycerophosphoryl diester phosphodiesterase [Winkia sp. UMB3158]|uniref:GP-PDE domain-containing protein n=1 Tax=Winkia neuii BV029A5 TaxID=888439 RepID=K0YQT2_9ACTO|nr:MULTISPECIES: glycerophosphoryl diester phosphodiesterase [Winkia]MDK8341846.1 glycerophosphoryl diester phosphodiesterase [Winkia sp. UMB3164B]OFT37965.1 glycerophosphoryl diester phosphodiesterase [Actinomyces sp. HMSC08A01]PLB79909.1 glycerophosphoryl diester phosphodiesterase [Actinomyces sp. UMB0138]PMC93893.1 glycerophosphoryl diester phosphodiesterase [Actinomyces sp. UMB0918]EJZ85828.1 hypothetical protein HMPREF9240_01301 [Winkia neuii BV029A5]
MIEKTIFAHRGANRLAPENTMAAFRAAFEHGAKWIETDVDIDKDGTPIICHDTTLDRTTDHTGRFYDLTDEEVAKVDAGSWFSKDFKGEHLPTLHELVDFLNETGMNANIELKANEEGKERSELLVKKVAEELARVEKSQIIVSSFSFLLLYKIKQIAPETVIGALWETCALYDDWRSVLEMLGAEYVHPEDAGLTKERIQEFRDFGVGVNVWTVNDPARINQLFHWGATGVFTDISHQLTDRY